MPLFPCRVRVLAVALVFLAAEVRASVGITEIPAKDNCGPVTVFYGSSSESQTVQRGPFAFDLAPEGVPIRGNGRLVVISHGSGGSPWVHADLARVLVEAGFVVAMPEHHADNYKDPSAPGPDSWKRRPAEVSHAIDAVAQDPRFGPLLELDKVGMYGVSAGGHTALTLAGGRWSPARLKQHCDAHIADDFQTCVGLAARLSGGPFDGIKKTVAQWVIAGKFRDANWYTYSDPRIVAVVAGVPFAADFDPASFASPPIPLGIVTAGQDKWLIPRFNSDVVLQACPGCERVADFPTGGHGALLSPLPPGLSGLLADLLNDPPGFDRAEVSEVNRKITAFFEKHLVGSGQPDQLEDRHSVD